MADEKAHSIRRELLARAYRSFLDTPSGIIVHHSSEEPGSRDRVREVEWLHESGYVNAEIGAQGDYRFKLTRKGLDLVEAGGLDREPFIPPSRSTPTHDEKIGDASTGTSARAAWAHLKTISSGIATIAHANRQMAVGAQIDRVVELTAGKLTNEVAEEVDYLLRRIDQQVAPHKPQRPGSSLVFPASREWTEWARAAYDELQEALRLLAQARATIDPISNAVDKTIEGATMNVFISHSSADREIAGAFVDLLRSALRLAAKEIRCTSVDGYKLPAGTHSDEQLRQEVFESKTFVALLSPVSITSVYVMFELGARWGSQRYFAPVMVAGFEARSLKAPLSSIHAISGTSDSDLHQLIQTLAENLKVEAEPAHVYNKALKTFIAAAEKHHEPSRAITE
jgi:hypothetical protein